MASSSAASSVACSVAAAAAAAATWSRRNLGRAASSSLAAPAPSSLPPSLYSPSAIAPLRARPRARHKPFASFARAFGSIASVEDADLLICDMAGTTIEEGGLVYSTLRKVINEDGMICTEVDIHEWHGAKKETVIEHFARINGTHKTEIPTRVARVGDRFSVALHEAYFKSQDKIRLIHPNILLFFDRLRAKGVKVALNTGYPPEIQESLVEHLELKQHIDTYISAYDVPHGRPYPYMIHTVMQRLGLPDVRRVAKVGDTVRDIEEGKNAGCGLVVGVLSGADDEVTLRAAGADRIVGYVNELK